MFLYFLAEIVLAVLSYLDSEGASSLLDLIRDTQFSNFIINLIEQIMDGHFVLCNWNLWKSGLNSYTALGLVCLSRPVFNRPTAMYIFICSDFCPF